MRTHLWMISSWLRLMVGRCIILAATVDDHLMKISHVIRGSEWLATLPLHAMIHRSPGWSRANLGAPVDLPETER